MGANDEKILFVTNMEQTAALLQDALEKDRYRSSIRKQLVVRFAICKVMPLGRMYGKKLLLSMK